MGVFYAHTHRWPSAGSISREGFSSAPCSESAKRCRQGRPGPGTMSSGSNKKKMIRFLKLLIRSLILIVVALFSSLAAMRVAIHGREVRVPNVQGMTTLRAQETANSSGLIVSVEDKFYSSDVPEGKLILQFPLAGSRVRRGWRIRVAESLGPQRATIPDLTGESELAATLNLRQRGLELATLGSVTLSDAIPDQIVAQAPPPNATDAVSPRVDVLLSEAPPKTEYVMPNFV